MSQTSHQDDSAEGTSSGDFLENFCKKVLKYRIFLGEFKEKRLVSSLDRYRDVIVVDVHAEPAIANDMDIVRGKLAIEHGEKGDSHWIGLTKSLDKNVLVWTELESFYTFGKYWFQIKTVRFRDNEILLKLKVLRSADDPAPRTEELPFKWDDIGWPMFENMGQDVLLWGKQQLRNLLIFVFSLRINPKQIFPGIKMVVLGVVFAVISAFQAIQLIGDFGLRFMAEIRKLLYVLTPIFLGTLDVFSKIVGGFYMLIAMIWRDSINLSVAKRNNFQALPAPRRWTPRRSIRN